MHVCLTPYLKQFNEVAIFLHRRNGIFEIGNALEYDRELRHLAKVDQIVIESVSKSRMQRYDVLEMDSTVSRKNTQSQNE